ncbi:MAG TPA: hypothetical protein VF221_13295, partial [Chloroflexota bacterium]
MSQSSLREQVQAVVVNLGSMWNGGRPVLDRLAATMGQPYGSPAAALAALSDEELERVFADGKARQELSDAFGGLTRYLTSSTWFDRAVQGSDGDRLRRLQG